jgi:predicted phosphoribosyltransferase
MQIQAGGVTGTNFNGAGRTEELQKLRQEVSDLRHRIDVIVAALAAGATALGVAELPGS